MSIYVVHCCSLSKRLHVSSTWCDQCWI